MLRRALVVVGFLLVAPSARADSTSSAAAEILFQEGRVLFNQEKYAEACDRFARSQQVEPAVGTLLNLGDCYKRIGKTASAWVAYQEASGLAKSRSDARRSALADDEARKIEPTLARLRIVVEGKTPDSTLLLNGQPVDPGRFASAVPIDPGEQTLEASAPGRKSWYVTVDVTGGATKTVTVPLLESRTPPSNTLATGLEIGGGVALAAAVTFGAIAMSRWSKVEDACPERHCPNQRTLQEQTAGYDAARTFAHLSTATAVLGVGALAAGLFLDFGGSKRVAVGVGGTNIALRATWQ